MALLVLPSVTAAQAPATCSWKAGVRGKRLLFPSGDCQSSFRRSGFEVRAFFPNPAQQPILKEALKEPVAFVGGIFAGLLRLDLNEDPLREWVARTVEASGIATEEISKREGEEEEQVAQQIEIE
ncbi:UPF0426 protein At1g28150, chloroplastic [Salvia miltiorrhiza]|uniref:UPF0426 protein At1g28150, chloroplastic n=1 Tax=Salvia miltiorrhiza TaxID=226208 RepID=UPI0025AC2CBF|nr:UPF0426 protein At1g28150, chloroplastic [Salvia miltiorrhiza]